MTLLNKIKNTFNKFNIFLQNHFIAVLICCIIILISINLVWFSQMDPNGNSDDFSFNRTIVEIGKDKDGKPIYDFISSSFTDACHYTLTSMSTVGYGDITPKTSSAKYWTMGMHIIIIIMSYKLFEYFSSDDASSQSLLKTINLLSAENDQLKEKLNNASIACAQLNVAAKTPLVPEFINILKGKIIKKSTSTVNAEN